MLENLHEIISNPHSEAFVLMKDRLEWDVQRLKIASVLMEDAVAAAETLRTTEAEAIEMVTNA